MTAAPSLALSRAVSNPLPRISHGTKGSAMNFGKSAGGRSAEDAERAWFAGLLWRAFPEAQSENQLAEMAAEVL